MISVKGMAEAGAVAFWATEDREKIDKLDSNTARETALYMSKEGCREEWDVSVPLGGWPGDEDGWIAPEKS